MASPPPLSPYTVLDLTIARAGPTAVRLLADWGANVIKIEAPVTGERDKTGALPYNADVDQRELWRRLAQRPRNVRFEEIDQLLRLSGWRLNNVRGSHHVYRSPAGDHLSIPRHGPPVKAPYVRIVLERTKEDDQ